MAISTQELSKALTSLQESIKLYQNAIEDSKEQKAFRDACIQRFEYCIELAWKVSIKILGSQINAAMPAIREMARNNLISNPQIWFDFIEARNETSHSYDEKIAQKVYAASKMFPAECEKLLTKLKEIKEK